MLAAYFVHDDKGWRLKGHAKQPMYTWMSTWAVALRRPSDLGYTDDGYNLPGLRIHPHLVDSNVESEGQLFATDLGGVTGRSAVRRQTLKGRCERAAELVAAEPNEPWLLWCGLNDEANLIAELTGARYWEAESLDRLKTAFTAIAEAMGKRYVLRYVPENVKRPGWHKIELKLRGKKGDVRTRTGYWVPNR